MATFKIEYAVYGSLLLCYVAEQLVLALKNNQCTNVPDGTVDNNNV